MQFFCGLILTLQCALWSSSIPVIKDPIFELLPKIAKVRDIEDLRSELQNMSAYLRLEARQTRDQLKVEWQNMSRQLRTEIQDMSAEWRDERQLMANQLRTIDQKFNG